MTTASFRRPAYAPAVVTTLAVLIITHAHGLGLTPDALSYLGAADSLAHGAGLRVPIADWDEAQSSTPLYHFPPLFSVLLAAPIAIGVDAIDAARWLQAMLAGALVWVAAALAGYVCRARGAVPLTAAVLLALPALNQVVLLLLSEPLFLVLLMLALWLMLRAPERVVALGCVTACCALTRYAGLAAPLMAALFIATRPIPLRRRARDLLMLLVPPLLALVIWRQYAGHFREYGLFTSRWGESFAQALATACDWLAPWPVPAWLRAPVVALVMSTSLALTWFELRRERACKSGADARLATSVRAVSSLWLSYAAVLVLSRLCADPDIPFDARLLLPLIVSATWLIAVVVIRRWQRLSIALRAALAAYLVSWFAGSIATSAPSVSELMERGVGYGSRAWQAGEFARWLRGPGRRCELYTNNPAAVWFVDRHSARMLPKAEEAARMPQFISKLRSTPSVIIGLANAFDPTLDPAELARQAGFVTMARFENASVWAAAQAPSSDLETAHSRQSRPPRRSSR